MTPSSLVAFVVAAIVAIDDVKARADYKYIRLRTATGNS